MFNISGPECLELLEFSYQNFIENQTLKDRNAQQTKILLDEFLQNEKEKKEKQRKVNFKAFSGEGISISQGIYTTQRLNPQNLKLVEALIGKQRVVNYSRIANAINRNVQDFNFIPKDKIDTERLASVVVSGCNWLELAKKFNSGHTAIQLFKHYKIVIKPNVKTTEFTRDEERLLKRGIELYHNNCAAIATIIPGRDLNQIYSKRKYFLKKTGKWGKDEDDLLLKAIEIHDTNWNLVADYIQSRNPEQCRNRYTNHLDPSLDYSKLRSDEKQQVLELVDRLGVKRLKEVAAHFPNRSPQMITNCYKVYLRKQTLANTTRKRKLKQKN